jgi:hypothetical protein
MSEDIIIEDKAYKTNLPPKFANYHNPWVPRCLGKARWTGEVNEIIIHETVTRDYETTLKVLRRRKLGVHFLIDPSGLVTQHADLVNDHLSHASRHNATSVGIEVINPYYPRYLKPNLPWHDTIKARWAHQGEYVLPLNSQVEALYQLVYELTMLDLPRLKIPQRWIGLNTTKKRLSMARVDNASRPGPGIYAHTYFGHADGGWPVLYCLLRHQLLEPEEAYDKAIELGTTQRWWVDLQSVL